MSESASESPQAESRPRLGRWARLTISAAVLALFLFLGHRHLGELHRLAEASLPIVALMFGCVALGRVGQGRTIQLLLLPLGHAMRFRDGFFISNLTGLSNLLLPRAGVGTAALYLNRRHEVPFSDYGSITVFLALLDAVATGLVGLLSLALAAALTAAPFDLRIALAFAGVVLGGVAATQIRMDLPARFDGRIARFLRSLGTGWKKLKVHGSAMARIAAIRLLLLPLTAVRLQLAFIALGVDVPFLGVLLAAMLGTLAQISSITPAGIGIREAAVAYAASAIGCTPATALAAAVLDRLVTTVFLIVAGQIGLWRSMAGGLMREEGNDSARR